MQITFLVISALVFLTYAQHPEDLPHISVVEKGEVKVVPDFATITLGAETTKTTIRDAYADVQSTLSRVVDTLKTNYNVSSTDIQTTDLRIFSYIDKTVQKYRINNRIHITVRDLELLGPILDDAVETGVNSVYGLSFGVTDKEKYEAQARDMALEKVKVKAKSMADGLGVAISGVFYATEVNQGGIRPVADSLLRAEGGNTVVEAGELTVTVSVQVNYLIEN